MESITLNVFFFVASIGVIALGAVWLVDSAARIAFRLGISELIVGLTVVAFGTSAPEVGVTVMAALRGSGDISVGNVVGSNIINISIILGGTALFGALRTPGGVVRRDAPFLLVITGLFILLVWNLRLDRLESILLLVIFAGYLIYLGVKKEPVGEEIPAEPMRAYDPILAIVGLVMIVGGANFMVDSASTMARHYGVSEWVIGSTIVAFGTSAPEIATSLTAAIKGRHDMSMGNLIGSNIFNLLLVLGIAGSIRTLEIDPISRVDVVLVAILTVIVYVFAVTGRKVTRLEGAILMGLGVASWVYNYMQ